MTELQSSPRNKKNGSSLRKGESLRSNGGYEYRWTDANGKRHSVYASTLDELRAKEESITKDQCDKIKTEARFVTVNEMFDLWKQLKRGLKDNTFQNYQYMYLQFVAPSLGKRRISTLVKSDVKRFYNTLADERGLAISTIDCVHTVLHQVLEMAVDDNYIRRNPSDNVLKELKQNQALRGEKRRALTKAEQDLFLNYLKRTPQNRHWYPVFAIMIGTGMRVGEAVGLRWCDIDLDNGMIDINHTLVYYRHAENGCYCNIHTPKTTNGIRQIPMLGFVKDAFLEEQRYQAENGIRCEATIDGYTDFIFVNRFGQPQHQGTLNKALRRIIRDCNDEVFLKKKHDPVLLPHFSCHSLRHTFTTRMCEAGVNVKVIQDALGHADVSTTLNIYADATRDLKKSAFEEFEAHWKGTLEG
ncbi:MAG: site-specific integrase [Clostridia bacterium]|nr:site-specific integrase [Clostridia bacterium]